MTLNEPFRPTTFDELASLQGKTLGPSQWQEITQEKIQAFADLTGDRQWIHVDPKRANVSQFGSTVAHGLYSLSLGPMLMESLMAFDGFAHSLNYGYNKVRFPAPLPVGSFIRMTATIDSVEEVPNGAQLATTQRFERRGFEKPTCVAQLLIRFSK